MTILYRGSKEIKVAPKYPHELLLELDCVGPRKILSALARDNWRDRVLTLVTDALQKTVEVGAEEDSLKLLAQSGAVVLHTSCQSR